MALFRCRSCEAKTETIALLREELARRSEQADILLKTNTALSEARVYANVYKPPVPARAKVKLAAEDGIPKTPEEIINYVYRPETTFEDLAKGFSSGAHV